MDASTTTPTSTRHKTLLGKDPTSTQLRLYTQFPGLRGFSERALDAEKLEAIVVLGLTFGTVQDRVLMLAPVAHEAWVLAEINKVADRVFETCKSYPNAAVVAKAWGRLFQKLAVTGRLIKITEEPSHWVSFGFATDDPLPEWMSGRLLVESEARNNQPMDQSSSLRR